MRFAESAWFGLCLVLGRLLRSARYSTTEAAAAPRRVRKHRRFYAPLFVWLGEALVRILDTGMRVLRQDEWERREREIYSKLYGAPIETDANGVLVLPALPGRPLATVLDDPSMDDLGRRGAIERAARALAGFHRLGFTHADAMAENVLVDPLTGAAHWFDFETVHDQARPDNWRRADDLRALLVTCLIRTPVDQWAAVVDLILASYGDRSLTPVVAANFASVWRRSLPYHLAQAPMSLERFRNVGRILRYHRSA